MRTSLIGTAAAVVTAVASTFAVLGNIQEEERGWESASEDNSVWLQYAPSRLPVPAKIVDASGEGVGNAIEQRSMSFSIDGTGRTIELCFAKSASAVLKACPSAEAVRLGPRPIDLPYIGVVDSDDPEAWINAFGPSAPAVADLDYLD